MLITTLSQITIFAMIRMQWLMGLIGSEEKFEDINTVEKICREYDHARRDAQRFRALAKMDLKPGETKEQREETLRGIAGTHLHEKKGTIAAWVDGDYQRLVRNLKSSAAKPCFTPWTEDMLDTVDTIARATLDHPEHIGVRSEEGFSMMAAYGAALINQWRMKYVDGGHESAVAATADVEAVESSVSALLPAHNAEKAAAVAKLKVYIDSVIGRLSFLYYQWSTINDGEDAIVPELPLLTADAISAISDDVSIYALGWTRVSPRMCTVYATTTDCLGRLRSCLSRRFTRRR